MSLTDVSMIVNGKAIAEKLYGELAEERKDFGVGLTRE